MVDGNQPGKGSQVIDARELEPPEPFERVMEALSVMEPGGAVLLILNRQPYPLYRVLERNGYRYRATQFPDGRFEIEISGAEK
jgi:uncharacterized protein (DUF2249 family)